MSRIIFGFFTLLSMFILSGCQEDERKNYLKANPETTVIGKFDGCEVKYINRGEHIRSFFIAQCDVPSTTVTNNYTVPSGKSQIDDRTVVITRQLQEQKQKLATQEQQIEEQYKKIQEAKKLLEETEKTLQTHSK